MLLSGHEDENIHEYFRRTAFPAEHEVEAILRELEESDGLTIPELEQRANLRYGQIDKALKYLSVEERAPGLGPGGCPIACPDDHVPGAPLKGVHQT